MSSVLGVSSFLKQKEIKNVKDEIDASCEAYSVICVHLLYLLFEYVAYCNAVRRYFLHLGALDSSNLGLLPLKRGSYLFCPFFFAGGEHHVVNMLLILHLMCLIFPVDCSFCF